MALQRLLPQSLDLQYTTIVRARCSSGLSLAISSGNSSYGMLIAPAMWPNSKSIAERTSTNNVRESSQSALASGMLRSGMPATVAVPAETTGSLSLSRMASDQDE